MQNKPPIDNHPLQKVKPEKIEGIVSESIPVGDRLDCLGSLATRLLNLMYQDRSDGMAAIQLGVPASVFVCHISDSPGRVAVIFDPEYFPSGKTSKKRSGMERCISYPMMAWAVPRYKTIKAVYQNETGGVITRKFKGNDAIMFQMYTDLCHGKTIKTEAMVEPVKKKGWRKKKGKEPNEKEIKLASDALYRANGIDPDSIKVVQ